MGNVPAFNKGWGLRFLVYLATAKGHAKGRLKTRARPLGGGAPGNPAALRFRRRRAQPLPFAAAVWELQAQRDFHTHPHQYQSSMLVIQ